MEEIIYIVTQGCYEEGYRIRAIFKNKEKAEAFCSCHENCRMEEFNFSDNKTYTPLHAVLIEYSYRKEEEKIKFTFKTLCEEDNKSTPDKQNSIRISNYDHHYIRISLYRRLPKEYDESDIRDKYTSFLNELRIEVLSKLSAPTLSTVKRRRIVIQKIKEFINDREK